MLPARNEARRGDEIDTQASATKSLLLSFFPWTWTRFLRLLTFPGVRLSMLDMTRLNCYIVRTRRDNPSERLYRTDKQHEKNNKSTHVPAVLIGFPVNISTSRRD